MKRCYLSYWFFSFIRLTLFQKLLIFFFTFIALELSLRATGFQILYSQSKLNKIMPQDKNKIRILTIGESTTADWYNPSIVSWPRQLEKILNKNSSNVRVYNVAVMGITSAELLSKVKDEISLYKPHIVIAMMGINDGSNLVTELDNTVLNLRTLKLFSMLRRELAIEHNHPLQNKDYPGQEKLISILKGPGLSDLAYSLIQSEISCMNSENKAQYYSFLASSLIEPIGTMSISSLTTVQRLFESSIETTHITENTRLFLPTIYAELNLCEKSHTLAHLFFDKGYKISTTANLHFRACTSGLSENQMVSLKKALSTTLTGVHLTNPSPGNQTSAHYRLLYEIMHLNDIKLIAMQYPTLELSDLKNYFEPELSLQNNFKDILFVENKTNFSAAFLDHSYNDLFVDRFEQTWGHTTNYGHELIATNVATSLLPLLGKIKPH